MWPWLRWCSNYRYASQLVGYALEDLAKWSEEDWRPFYLINKKYDQTTSKRQGVRDTYIAFREGWHEDEIESNAFECELIWNRLGGDHRGFDGMNLEEYTAHRLAYKQMVKAVNVLYAYGMFNKKTGQIELDNLKKLK